MSILRLVVTFIHPLLQSRRHEVIALLRERSTFAAAKSLHHPQEATPPLNGCRGVLALMRRALAGDEPNADAVRKVGTAQHRRDKANALDWEAWNRNYF